MSCNFNLFKHDTPDSNNGLGYDPEDWDMNYDPDADQEIEHEDEEDGMFEDPYELEYSVNEPDANDEWINGAYDDNCAAVFCEHRDCDSELRFDPVLHDWYCPECGARMDRKDYFDYIGANPPGPACLHDCDENYPWCKHICDRYDIDPNDPMLT